MLIYAYQSHGYRGSLISIVLSPSRGELTIVGVSPSKQRYMITVLQGVLPSLPKVTVQLPDAGDVQAMLAPLALALSAYEKNIFSLQSPPVLCYGALNLEGVLMASHSLRDIPSLCLQHGVGLVLVGRHSLLPESQEHLEICECDTIQEACSTLCKFSLQHQNENNPESFKAQEQAKQRDPFANIIGLKEAKKALIYAVAGNLPLLLYGPPGSGKTLLLSRIASLLPPLTSEGKQEISAIHCRRIETPPVFEIRVGMHEADLLKGAIPHICKAHGGALIVDELSHQMPKIRTLVASLMEGLYVQSYPVHTLIACATNACSCANLGSREEVCRCSEQHIDKFWAKLGHPLLDRFAIALAVTSENLLLSEVNAPVFDYERIQQVRAIQALRSEQEIMHLLPLYTKVAAHTQHSFRRSLLCCKLARTIADFEGKHLVTQTIMEEAHQLYLLPKDRHYR